MNKPVFLVLIGLITSFTFFSCSGDSNINIKEEVSVDNLISVNYKIEGMVCAMGCAATIEEEVANIPGVTKCDVNYEQGKAHIEFDKVALLEDDIISKIESLADGKYSVSKPSEPDTESDRKEKESGSGMDVNVEIPTFKIPNLFAILLDQL